MEESLEHRPVLLQQAVEALDIRADGVYVDGTFGRGGHSQAIMSALGDKGRLLAFDKDPQAIATAERLFGADERFSIVRGTFAMLRQVTEAQGLLGKVDGILLDLGVSSPQLDDPERGFSFMQDGPLEMRMDPDSGLSASEWLQSVGEEELSVILKELGEERFHKRVARAIVTAAKEKPISRTLELAEIVSAAIPRKEKHKHPATRTFQAIRIYLNRELEDLKQVLEQVRDVLKVGGRLVVISFHSLEDRIVKRFVKEQQFGVDDLPRDLPIITEKFEPKLRAVGKPVKAGEDEVKQNVRARSAIMRIVERAS